MWGPESAGKSSLALIMAAQYQKKYPDRYIAWVDMEQTFDWNWAITLGVDPSRLRLRTPENAEDTADLTKDFMESGLFSLVVLDSIGGMISRIEIEKDAGDATVGKVPQIVTRMVKICAPIAARNQTSVLVVNQVRAAIGGYGSPETTGGGWALKHVTSMKFHVKRAGGQGTRHTVKEYGNDIPVGHQIAVRVQKNKMAAEGKVALMWFHHTPTEKYGPVGLDPIPEVFDFAKRYGLLGSKGGGYYDVLGTEVRGEPEVIQYLRENPEKVESLRQQILDRSKGKMLDTEGQDQFGDEDDPYGMAEMVD